MGLSLAFSGFTPLTPTIPGVCAAEEAGLDGVWTAEHIGFHAAVVPHAAYLRLTQRLDIGMVGLGGRPARPRRGHPRQRRDGHRRVGRRADGPPVPGLFEALAAARPA